MAAIDSFLLVYREIRESLFSPKDLLMVGGGIYTLIQAFKVLKLVTELGYVHGLSHYCARRDTRSRFGQWAVVTGSTHGIGRAYAQELASQGMNVAIIAIDHDECVKVAEDITNEFKVVTLAYGVDFNDIESKFEDIRHVLKDYDIGILVNNVGVNYDVPNYFLDIPKEKFVNICNVNVLTTTLMTNMILPNMLKRRRGAIVNISSGASLKPQPQLSVFTASEAYIDSFTTALSYEYKPSYSNGYHDIVIQCLTPFYVSTKMTSYKKKSLFIPSADEYARSAIKTLGWSSKTTGYWPHSLQLWLCDWLNDRAWFWFISQLNTSFRISIMRKEEKYSH